jgi:hypothetical protein
MMSPLLFQEGLRFEFESASSIRWKKLFAIWIWIWIWMPMPMPMPIWHKGVGMPRQQLLYYGILFCV